MHIEVLYSDKNDVLIKDLATEYLWVYSYNKPLLWYDGKVHLCKDNLTQTNKLHMKVFLGIIAGILGNSITEMKACF